MAILTAPKSSAADNLGEPPPKGIHLAVCLDVVDTFNDRVLRHKRPYGSEKEEDYEYINRERFIFGVKCKDGSMRKVRSKPMRISLHENSALRAFLASWLGESPKGGLDSATLIGKGAQLTLIESPNQRGDGFWINIGTISEVMDELKAKVPKIEDFGATANEDNTGEEIPF
jgi:hypothetical protein